MLKNETYKRGLFVYIKTAMQVKTRWDNKLLAKKGYISMTGNRCYIGDVLISDHIQDSIRHAVHYKTYHNRFKGANKEERV